MTVTRCQTQLVRCPWLKPPGIHCFAYWETKYRPSLRPCPEYREADPADGNRETADSGEVEVVWLVQAEHGYVVYFGGNVLWASVRDTGDRANGYMQYTEGDVEGVMDRPVGNTTDVYAECEKWYVFQRP